jgi:hypothetical protein
MNFGLVAYELLQEMYEEEFDRIGQTGWETASPVAARADIPRFILGGNLFGIDIDPVALKLARATLRLKSGVDLSRDQWNLWQADSLFDAAIAQRCQGRFDVVATNPPYVSSRNLSAEQVWRMKERFPAAWRDLYACFIERSLDFCRPGGRVGLLVMQSFMFTGSYQKLRKRISDRAAVETLAHFGPGLFDIGNPGTLQTVALSMRKEPDENKRAGQNFAAFRLTDASTAEKESVLQAAIKNGSMAPPSLPEAGAEEGGHSCLSARISRSVPLPRNQGGEEDGVVESPVGEPSPASAIRFDRPQSALLDLPRRSWAYWVDSPIRRAFATFPRLAEVARPRQGLATTDNSRFVRYWWEVEATNATAPAQATPGMWFPYAKSGQFRRWYESPRHRVNWLDDGREIKEAIALRYPYLKGQWRWVAKNTAFYGRPGITWSYLTSGRFSARRLEAGSIFDVAGSSLFPADIPGMLALLNSTAIHRLLEAINPTVNFQVGDLAELPVPAAIPAQLGQLAESAIAIQKDLDACDETAPDFIAPMPWNDAVERMQTASTNLARIERQIDVAVSGIYGFAPEPDESATSPCPDRTDLARRWISYAIGLLLGRWDGAPPGRLLQLDPIDAGVADEVRNILITRAGERPAGEIVPAVGGIGRFLAGEFYRWHVRLYRQRPPYWGLRSRGKSFLLAHDSAEWEALAPIIRPEGISFPHGWRRHIDGGIQPGLAPLRAIVADPALKKVLDQFAGDNR